MREDQWVQRLITAIRRRAGYRLSEAERKAEVAPGYLRKAQSDNRNIVLSKFLRVCVEADINPGELFAEVFPSPGLDEDLGIPVPEKSPPRIVLKVRRRLSQLEATVPEPPPLPEDWIDWLDSLRYDDPVRALELAEQAVEFVEVIEISAVLGVWASANRLIANNDDALLAFREAIALARAQKDLLREAGLLLRGASLVTAISANYSAALNLAERATALYARIGVSEGVAAALVKQGIFLFYLGEYEGSKQSWENALAFREEIRRWDRTAALHGLGALAQARGDFSAALSLSCEASSLTKSKYEKGKLQWLAATAHAGLGEWSKSTLAFEEALRLLLQISPVEAALCACDQVRGLLAAGKVEKAREFSALMRRLIEPLSSNSTAVAAIRDLIRSEHEGIQLTIEFLAEICTRIEGSRRGQPRQLEGSAARVDQRAVARANLLE